MTRRKSSAIPRILLSNIRPHARHWGHGKTSPKVGKNRFYESNDSMCKRRSEIIALPPHTMVKWGHCTSFVGSWNDPQDGGTRPPLPTPEDRLFFLLTYLKTYSLQVVQGRLFGMGQSKANQWIHVLLPALLAALRTLGDAPTRSLAALAQRLGVAEADAATVVTPRAEEPAPMAVA